MRISDWSSDVCSSDLGLDPKTHFYRPQNSPKATPTLTRLYPKTHFSGQFYLVFFGFKAPLILNLRRIFDTEDQKSVVEEKSDDVRVDIGGSRIFENQTMRTVTVDERILLYAQPN